MEKWQIGSQTEIKMKVQEFKEKYIELQKEAKSIEKELKTLAKRYGALAKKAVSLGNKADYDKELYVENQTTGESETNGWNVQVLLRLTDFEDDAEFFLQDARTVLLNLVDQPFMKRQKKASK